MQMEHQNLLYKAFREELVILLEQLRLLRLENQAGKDEIQKPTNWGEVPKDYKEMVQNIEQIFSITPPKEKDVPMLREEYNNRLKALDSIGPVVQGAEFLYPSEDFWIMKCSIYGFH